MRIDQFGVDNSFETDHPNRDPLRQGRRRRRRGRRGDPPRVRARDPLTRRTSASPPSRPARSARASATTGRSRSRTSSRSHSAWPRGSRCPAWPTGTRPPTRATVPHCLRRLDMNLHYPADLNGEVHHDGRSGRARYGTSARRSATSRPTRSSCRGRSTSRGRRCPSLANRTVDGRQQLYGNSVANTVRQAFVARGIL